MERRQEQLINIALESNMLSEAICKFSTELKPSFLDNKNILWKISNGEWIGKRSVYTKELRACWINDLRGESIRSWWCGKESDYEEVFKRPN